MNIGIVSPFNPYVAKEYLAGQKLPQIHGNATAVNTLVLSLLEQGHKVAVYTASARPGKTVVYQGASLKVSVISKVFQPKGMANVRVVGRIKREIEKDVRKLDILHAHWTYEYAAAARGFEHRLPVFCTVRDWCPYQKSLASGLRERYSWFLNGLLFSYVMKSKRISFLANSSYTYGKIKGAYPQKEVACIPNPIQRKYIVETHQGHGCEKRTGRVFLSICQGLAEKRKNIHTLLAAFQMYRRENPNAALILAGGYTSAWKRGCEGQGLLEGVRFTGAVGHDQVFRLLDQSDVLVHPSLEETFGNTLLEAMARRVVCIGGRDAGAVPEVLGEGKRGILCDVTSAASIAEAMRSVEHTEYRNRLVDAATGYLKGQYADNVIAAQHIRLYQKKLENKPD